MEFTDKMKEIDNKIKEIDKKLELLEERKQEDKTPIGMISILNGYVNLELLLDVELFDDDKLKRLENIANQLQQLILDIQNDMEEDK